jgi:multidrug efflux pump subunit AcrA (membrane-fusion protein)
VLPEQNSWSGNDTKVYQTIVTITDKVEGLKPGMTAISEILINKLPDVVTVPLQAVVEKDDKTYVVVKDDHENMQPRFVELGEASDTRVSVQSGLSEGESVAVNAQDLKNAVFGDNAIPAT